MSISSVDFLHLFERADAAVSDHPPVDIHTLGEQMARDGLRVLREREWNEFFGPEIVATDWSHPGLSRNAKAIRQVREWQYCERGLLVRGPTGTGKTRALAALVRRLHVEECRVCGLWNFHELCAAITQQCDFGRDDATAFIETLARKPVLVIDDLGQEGIAAGQQQRVQQWVFRLIDRRYATNMPCIISTNHDAESLAATMRQVSADPFIRRLLATCEPVAFV